MSTDKLVTLKNGKQELAVLVAAFMPRLESLQNDEPILFYELVMICRDRNHKLFGTSGDALKRMNFLQANSLPHDSIRNIVLSSIVGDGRAMILTSPVEN